MGITCPRCQAENPADSKYCKECATPLSHPAPGPGSPTMTAAAPREELTTGTLFAGRYQIVEELGGGGMGRVYRALDTKVGEEIAVKLIKPEIASDRATIERFKNELKIARKIVHKNVGRVYDLNEDRGTFYFTMEYVRGEDLKAFIHSSGQMALGTSLRVARQVAEGLAEAHELGIVHRDLKPSNIMIDRHGNARIMDFGIARLAGAKGMTGGNVMLGTPEYMSPEQVEGKDATPASDFYSLGIVLFEMLTGRVPFEGETALSIAVKQKTEAPPDPRTLNPEIPEGLGRVILKCLEKSRERRYQSAAEFLADLAGVEKALPTTTHTVPLRRPATSKEITVRLPSRKVWIPAAVIGVALLAFAVWQLIPEKVSERPTVAVMGFSNKSGDAGLDYLREAIPHLLITSLGESKHLRVTSWERMKDLLGNAGKDASAMFDEAAGFEACRSAGIEAIVLGSFVKAGETYATDVQVLDVATKDILRNASAKGDGVESILKSQIDEISRKLRRGLALARLKIETPVPKIVDLTTGSMEAYTLYLKAQEADENFLYADGRKLAEQAVALDPNFAVAHSLLSKEAGQLLDYPARDAALEKAKALSSRATERERLSIEARYAAIIERDPAKQLRIREELVEKYPDDKYVHSDLGSLLIDRGRVAEGIAELEKAVAVDPRFGFAYNQLGYEYAAARDFAKALSCFERYAALRPGLPNPVDSIAEMNMFMGNLDEAVKRYQEALSLRPGFYGSCRGLAYVYALKEDYGEVERWLDEYVKRAPTPQEKMAGIFLRSFFDYLRGRLDRALSALLLAQDQARKFGFSDGVAAAYWMSGQMFADKGEFEKARQAFRSWADHNLARTPALRATYLANRAYYLGRVEFLAGRPEAARTQLAEFDKTVGEASVPDRAYLSPRVTLLRADIALAAGSPGEAVRLAEGITVPPLPNVNINPLVTSNIPFLKDILARAYWKSGDLDKAIAEYQRLTTIDPGNNLRFLIPPLYHYRFGRVLEEKGEKDRARLEYEKFLKYWADADPTYTELGDARSRLARLK